MSLKPDGSAPYTTVQALTTVIDWFRDKAPSGPITADVVIRAGVPESLGRRTIHSLLLLDLIDKDGNPSEQFESFRNIRGEEEYRNALQEWLRATYGDVLVYCDPASDSLSKIVEAFRGYQPQGQRRAMAALFLGLWKHAGLVAPASPAGQAKERSVPKNPRPKGETRIKREADRRGENQSTGFSTDGLPPGLVGLLHQIPRGGRPWTAATRDEFLSAFTAVLNFSVPIGDPRMAATTTSDSEADEVSTP